MVWPFGKKKQEQEPQPERQGPDFGGALGAVSNRVMLGNADFLVWGDLGRFGVDEAGLIAWVRGGNGREVLSLARWRGLAAAGLGVLSEVAGDVVRELEGEVGGHEDREKSGPKPEKPTQNDAITISIKPGQTLEQIVQAVLEQNPELREQIDQNPELLQQLKQAIQQQLQGKTSTGGSSYRPNTSHIKPEAIELFDQGVNRYQAGDVMGAIALWSQAIEIDPKYASAYNGRGIAYKNLKRYEEAIADYTRAIDIAPNDAYAYNCRGIAYSDLKRYEEAIADYTRAMEIAPNDAYAYNGRGIAYKNLKRYEKAIADYTRAIEIDPNYAIAYNNRGFAHNDLKRYEEEISDYNRAIEIDSNYAAAYNNRGNAHNDLKRYEEAISDYNRAIEIDPNYAYAYNGRGIAYKTINRYAEAIRDYDQAVHLQPDYWQAWGNRGLALFDYSGYQAALENYKTGLSHLNPDQEPLGCAVLHRQTGRVHAEQGHTQPNPRLYFIQATQSYNTAYDLIEANPFHTSDTLKILRDWIKCDRALGENEAANQLTLNAIHRLTQALTNADPSYRKILRVEFQDFYTLNVDRLISQNQPWQALIEAEQWKRLALTWLQDSNADPQPLTRETLQTAIGQLCPNPQTAILYWHLSPAQINTFLLRPHQDPQIIATIPTDPPFTPTTKTTENFTEWLKQYKTTYNQTRKTSSEKVPLPKGDLGGLNWRDELPPLLAPLPNLLNIPTINPHLTDLHTLILIPHRDLHLLPLHALLNPAKVPLKKGDLGGFRITYRPNLTLSIPTHSPNPDPTLLIIKNPQSTIATETLPWAETEVDSLSTLYTSTIIKRPNAHLAHITPHLTQPNHQFHFAGHGNSDPDNPLASCLYLNNKDILTVETLLTLNLPAYDLVSLSACETALTNTGEFIDEFVGLPSAFLKSGAKQVLSSQWSVESFPTTLTMIEFHRRYRAGMPAAQALAEVQIWLRNLTREDLQTWLQTAQTTWPNELLWRDKLDEIEPWPTGHQPYQNPYYWAAFIVTQ